MIRSKRLPAVVAVLLSLCIVFCGVLVYADYVFDSAGTAAYEPKLFGDEVLSIDIQIDAEEWQAMLQNAQAKEWISADLVINGESFAAVGVRTKGNSSLSMGSGRGGSSGSARYSLQFSFNKYVKGQTCYGLDTFCVNNMMGDASYMKDYLAYDIMEYIGVETPLRNYARVTVNGEDYGFGLALERYDEAFLDRAYNTTAGQLYNVKIQMGMREDFEGDFEEIANAGVRGGRNRNQEAGGRGMAMPEGMPEGMPEDMPEMGGGGMGGGGMSGGGMGGGGMGGGMGGRSGGGSLVYTDDEVSSYGSIFDNAVFSKTSDQEKQRVITALKHLNEGTDLEKYIDVDATLRYFAAHTVVVNLDSYTSNMQQNYYLYERDGKLTILPWDYGLSFGGFQSGDASGVINFPIDTPVSGVSMEDRPLLSQLLAVEEYEARYHAYLREIAEGYFQSGQWAETISALDAKIDRYVKSDSSAYFTYDQYLAALPVLKELGLLRAESILGQLEGSIPSTSEGQGAEDAALVDASSIDLSALGSMMGGGNRGENASPPDNAGNAQGGNNFGGFGGFGDGGNMPDMSLMQEAMALLAEAGGELTDELRAALLALGISEEMIEMVSGMQGGMQGGGGMNFPGGAQRPEGSGTTGTASTGSTLGYAAALGALLLLLVGAMGIVVWPRKNKI